MNAPPFKPFRVATFYHPRGNDGPKASHISAYTRDYNSAWDGCVMYTVEAINGAQAKAVAVQMRLGKELAATP